MKSKSLLISLCFGMVGFITAAPVSLQLIVNQDLNQERQFFKKCWSAIYQDYSLLQLGITDLSDFLDETFDQEVADYNQHGESRSFFHIIQEDQVVGYISIDVSNDGVAFIKQLAILPEFWTIETLNHVFYGIQKIVPMLLSLEMTLPVCAESMRDVVEQCGFCQLPDKGNDAHLYLSMQYTKCGTCMCDVDDVDADDDYEFFQYGDPNQDLLMGVDVGFRDDLDAIELFDEEDEDGQGCSMEHSDGFCTFRNDKI